MEIPGTHLVYRKSIENHQFSRVYHGKSILNQLSMATWPIAMLVCQRVHSLWSSLDQVDHDLTKSDFPSYHNLHLLWGFPT